MTPLCQALAALAAQGRTAQQAADEIGTTAKSARMLGYRHGFRFAFESTHNVRLVQAAADAEMSPSQIAKHIGIDTSNVHRIAKKHGITFQTAFARRKAARAAAAAAKAFEDAERMVRWRAMWAAKKAAAPPPPPRVVMVDEETLGELMRLAAQRDGMAPRDRRSA